MIYTKTRSLILIADASLSESIIYSVLLEFDGEPMTPEEKRVQLVARCIHAMHRVTINVGLNTLRVKGLINEELEITQLPSQEPTPTTIHPKAGRPYVNRKLQSTSTPVL